MPAREVEDMMRRFGDSSPVCWMLVLGACSAGCHGREPAEGREGVAVQEVEQQVCVTVQRGTGPGAVADADVQKVAPATNFGGDAQAIVGWPTTAGSQKLLLR